MTESQKPQPYLILTSWGLDLGEPSNWALVLGKVAGEGYKAIECVGAFSFDADRARFRQELDKAGLGLIVQIHTDGGYFDDTGYVYCKTSNDVTRHVDSLRKQCETIKSLSPIHINVHAGHDSWEKEQSIDFFLQAQQVIDDDPDLKNKVSFETHRFRLMYNPHDTRRLLSDPRLQGKIQITADLSHWCCVCMTIFDETNEVDAVWWPETLRLVAQHTGLIHARVGHDQGPQVADPRDPVNQHTVQQHLKWWKTIWKHQSEKWKEDGSSGGPKIVMEFGPAPYMPSLPYTNMPVASQWDVNNAMRDMVVQAFEEFLAE